MVELTKLLFTKLISVIRLAKVFSLTRFKFSHPCTIKDLSGMVDWSNLVHYTHMSEINDGDFPEYPRL